MLLSFSIPTFRCYTHREEGQTLSSVNLVAIFNKPKYPQNFWNTWSNWQIEERPFCGMRQGFAFKGMNMSRRLVFSALLRAPSCWNCPTVQFAVAIDHENASFEIHSVLNAVGEAGKLKSWLICTHMLFLDIIGF